MLRPSLPLLGLIAVAATFITNDVTAAGVAPASCMARRLYKAGMRHTKVLKYEQNMLRAGMTEKLILSAPTVLLQYLLTSEGNDAKAIQDCIAKRSARCKDYDPCQNGGECELNGRKNAYVCVCHRDFTGRFCTIPHPAPAGEFRQVQKVVSSLQKEVKELKQFKKHTVDLLKFHGTGCNLRTLGYKYQSRHAINTHQDTGTVATIVFRKKYAATVLRLTYSTNILAHSGVGATGRWYFLIDGNECRTPTKIDMSLHNAAGRNNHQPAALLGICEATDAGPIGRGDHTITVNVGRLKGYRQRDLYTGWQSTSLMEIQEMCPQF